MSKHRPLFAFLPLLFLSVVVLPFHQPSTVLAEADLETTRPVIAPKPLLEKRKIEEVPKMMRATAVATRSAVKEQRCKEAQSKTTEQIKKFDGMKSEQAGRYTAITKNLDATLTKLRAEGVSVVKLEADKEQLNLLIGELIDALELYLVKLEAAQALAPNCGSAPGEFRQALQATRSQMQVVRAVAQSIRSFITSTLKVDLKAARQEIMAMQKVSPRPTVSPRSSTRLPALPAVSPTTSPKTIQ